MSPRNVITWLSLLLALAVAGNGYQAWLGAAQQRKIDRLQNQLSAASVSAARPDAGRGESETMATGSGGEIFLERKPAEITKSPRYAEEPIACSLCGGEGKLNLRTSRKNYSTYPCPVCAAQGRFTLRVPRQAEICGACRGVGKVGVPPVYEEATTHTARLCVPCNGSGWVKKRS